MASPPAAAAASASSTFSWRNFILLFVARGIRLFAYGTIGVLLALYLHEVRMSDAHIGLLLTLTLLGDAGISLLLSVYADKLGRRLTLVVGSALMLGAGVVYAGAAPPLFWVLLLAATLGVISPSGNEVGPFMALEQASLADMVGPSKRTMVFAWYNLLGYAATACGALAAGDAVELLHATGTPFLAAYRFVFAQYAACAGVLALLFCCLSREVEVHGHRAHGAHGAHTRQAHGGASRCSLSGSTTPLSARSGRSGRGRRSRAAATTTGDGASEPLLVPDGGGGPTLAALPSFAVSFSESFVEESDLGSAPASDDDEEEGGGAGAGLGDAAPDATAQPHQPPSLPPLPRGPVPVAAPRGDVEGGKASAPAPSRGPPAPPQQAPRPAGWAALDGRTRRIAAHLSLLFALDSFAGGMITGTLLAYYFQVTYSVGPAYLGGLLFVSNIIAAVSSLVSGWVAEHLGLINTMVFTHLPSNVLLIAVPLMPSLHWATAMVFLRYSLSQMDVAPRTAYVSGVFSKEERTAALGLTTLAKTLGAAGGPLVTGYLAGRDLYRYAFYLCGGLKIVYDLMLLASFRAVPAVH